MCLLISACKIRDLNNGWEEVESGECCWGFGSVFFFLLITDFVCFNIIAQDCCVIFLKPTNKIMSMYNNVFFYFSILFTFQFQF